MKILHLNMSDALGGLELITETYFRELRARQIDVSILLRRQSRLHRRLMDHDGAVLTYPAEGKFHIGLMLFLRGLLRDQRFDILHVHRSIDIWTASFAVRGLPTALVYTSYNFLETTPKTDPLHRFIYGRCNLLTVFSTPQRNGFLRCLPVDGEKVQTISHGIALSKFRPELIDEWVARSSLDLSENDLVIGVIGRIMPTKGQWMLVEIADRLKKEFPNLKILFVGADSKGDEDTYGRTLREKVRQYGLESVIFFTGFREDIPSCLAALDVFVMPSRAENFGTVLLEAMAMERPCVATRSGGTPEILDNGKAGFLFEPESPDDLLDVLRPLLRDKGMRKTWGALARTRLESAYPLNRTMDRWLQAYEALLSDRQTR